MIQRTGWKKGDPLPDNELWTWEMAEQYAKRHRKTLLRRGLRPVRGERGLFDPGEVRALFSQELHVGLRRAG